MTRLAELLVEVFPGQLGDVLDSELASEPKIPVNDLKSNRDFRRST